MYGKFKVAKKTDMKTAPRMVPLETAFVPHHNQPADDKIMISLKVTIQEGLMAY